jgi:hypothetical protein
MSTDEKKVNGNGKTSQKKRQRSPGYPAITIDDAITRLRQIYQHDRRAFTTYNAILGHMGYSTKPQVGRSGTSGRAVAALRQYGLLDETDGQFRVSDLGFKILNLPEESEERAELIRQAAVNPPIFRKLLAYYQGEIPSDAAIRSHLILNERFNPDTVDQFIRVFRATIDIANPSPDDYTAGEESEETELPFTGGKPAVQQTASPAAKQEQGIALPPSTPPAGQTVPPVGATGEKVLVFNISRNSEARVFFNGPVTQEAITKLSALLELSKDTFPTKEELERPQPRAATWRNKDHDQPVKVVGEAGELDGRRYVKIEGSDTGVPEDELEFTDEQAKGAA